MPNEKQSLGINTSTVTEFSERQAHTRAM